MRSPCAASLPVEVRDRFDAIITRMDSLDDESPEFTEYRSICPESMMTWWQRLRVRMAWACRMHGKFPENDEPDFIEKALQVYAIERERPEWTPVFDCLANECTRQMVWTAGSAGLGTGVEGPRIDAPEYWEPPADFWEGK